MQDMKGVRSVAVLRDSGCWEMEEKSRLRLSQGDLGTMAPAHWMNP